MIAPAAKLGAKTLVGVDNDELAVRIAEENLKLNNIDPRAYRLIAGNLADGVRGRFGFVAANILFEVIQELLDTIHHHMERRGILVCSGIIRRQEKAVTNKLESIGYDILAVEGREEWIAVAGRL